MAEGFFRHYGGQNIVVKSAGISPGGVNPLAVRVMQETGIDISRHTSDSLTEYLNQSFDYVITVCDNAQKNCPMFSGGGTRLHWSLEDPHSAVGSEDEVMDTFRRIRDQIKVRVQSWLVDRTSQA
ncbi:MAG: arsenate reductase ArsC [candidate division Zixibacteria bacterium]|nr:arsenate reductase ArsC [candidate division Zixibacteria bacterium]